jgi:4a-hydroxytetrahydrobiopterin dehydratase
MKLSSTDVQAAVSKMSGWAVQGDAITRQFTFASFPDAIAYVTRLAFEAQAHDHHPDLTVSYKKVTVTWSTHSEGGVTDKDLDGARQSDTIARAFTA